MQGGCYVSRLHSILSANLLRRRICLFGIDECPIFQGNALGAFEEKRGINFFRNKARFLISFSEKRKRGQNLPDLEFAVRAFIQGAMQSSIPATFFLA